jgi:hypothetical protein
MMTEGRNTIRERNGVAGGLCGMQRRKVTFYYTLASITETVPIRRVPNGLESLVDRLALAQPQLKLDFVRLYSEREMRSTGGVAVSLI